VDAVHRTSTREPSGSNRVVVLSTGVVMNLSTVKARVDQLLAMTSQQPSIALQSALYQGTLTVMQALYGSESSQEKELQAYIEMIRQRTAFSGDKSLSMTISAIKGSLETIKAELDSGFVGSLRASLTGEVLADMIRLAREALGEPGDDTKNVASVLVAAAFEDMLRRLINLKDPVHRDSLQNIITALKGAGVLQGTEVSTALNYLPFRNHALHAQWDKVTRLVVESALAFTEHTLLKHFT
jgi:hypothetical protein